MTTMSNDRQNRRPAKNALIFGVCACLFPAALAADRLELEGFKAQIRAKYDLKEAAFAADVPAPAGVTVASKLIVGTTVP